MPKRFPPEFKAELAAEGFPVTTTGSKTDGPLRRQNRRLETVTCGVLGFSTQAFYKWQADPICDRDFDDAHLTNAIVDVHADDPEFGYRFIADELEREGHQVGEGRVHRLCREHRIWSTTTKKGRRSSGKTPGPAVDDDLLNRDFSAPAPNVTWLTDITEHPTTEGKRTRSARPWPDASRAGQWWFTQTEEVQPISLQGLHRGAQGQPPQRLDGPTVLGRRQRGDGVLLLPAAEERPQSPPLEDARRTRLRDHVLDRAHLQPTPSATRAWPVDPRRVSTCL